MVDREGEGPVLILLHGIGGNRTNWRAQLPVFSKTFHCVAWDARGYGDSDDYEGPLDFEDFAHDLLRVIDHFDADRAHLCGLSMGGQIAQCFYGLYPQRVASLVLAATFTHWGAALGDAALDNYLSLRLKPLQEEGKEPSDIADAAASALLGPTATEDHHAQLANSINTLHKESYIKTLQSAVPRSPARLESIQVQVCIFTVNTIPFARLSSGGRWQTEHLTAGSLRSPTQGISSTSNNPKPLIRRFCTF